MKQKIVLIDGPFDGHVGEAHGGVVEFWKRADGREYKYSRVSEREFRYDKRWRKTKGSTDESKGLRDVREQGSSGSGGTDRCPEGQSTDHQRGMAGEGSDQDQGGSGSETPGSSSAG